MSLGLKDAALLFKAFNMKSSDITYVARVLDQARSLGVVEFVEGGRLLFNGVRIVGKGQNSLVIKCRVEELDVECACKILRPDSPRTSLIKEGLIIRRANEVGVGPRLVNFSRMVLVYEFVEGVAVADWISRASRARARELVRSLLFQCYELDRIGIRHGELSRLEDHVIVSSNDKPFLIDFESASSGYWQNVPQAVNGLARMGLAKVTDELKRLLREYKRQGSREILEEVISMILP